MNGYSSVTPDELFFVDLPDEKGIKSILKVNFKKLQEINEGSPTCVQPFILHPSFEKALQIFLSFYCLFKLNYPNYP